MSTTLNLYKKLLLNPSPWAKKTVALLEQRIGDTLYEMPYLTGRVQANPRHTPPTNAPTFVEWARFTTQPVLTAHQVALGLLQAHATLSVWQFSSPIPLLGRVRQAWYNTAARWGDQSLANQQMHINHQLIDLLRQQETRLTAQEQELLALRHAVATYSPDPSKEFPHE